MQQTKTFFNPLCYNLGMSENKPSGPMYPPGYHPHEGDPRVDPQARAVRRKPVKRTPTAAQQRRRLEEETMIPAFFTPEPPIETKSTPVAAPEAPAPVSRSEAELIERKLRFQEGTPMFEVRRSLKSKIIIPRTPEDAEVLFLGTLPERMTLKIGQESLARGKRGGTIIQVVGKSAFGAFVLVLYPTVDDNDQAVEVPMLADINRRTLRSQNEGLKFQVSLRRLLFPYAK